tara:strand:+ start:68484 stop:68813 length:330 start_codon:yes stop_codon:yes gene_type:complete
MSNQNNAQNAPNSERYIGKVQQKTFQKKDNSGSFEKFSVLLDNPSPTNADGSPNQYHKGVLIWFDAETGEKFQVKQLELAGVSDNDRGRGFINSVKMKLDNTYHVDKLG